MSSHSTALQTTPELDTPRSALTMKCSPKQPVTLRQPCIAELTRLGSRRLSCAPPRRVGRLAVGSADQSDSWAASGQRHSRGVFIGWFRYPTRAAASRTPTTQATTASRSSGPPSAHQGRKADEEDRQERYNEHAVTYLIVRKPRCRTPSRMPPAGRSTYVRATSTQEPRRPGYVALEEAWSV